MDKNDSRVNQILGHLASAASVAKDGVSDAVHTAGNVVSGKYDAVKLNFELSRLHDEQAKLFSDIGRIMFMIKSGAFENAVPNENNEMMDAQATVDALLEKADQKQQEIDGVSEKLLKLNGSKVCAVCGKVSDAKDMYCSACGAKLPTKE